MSEIFNTPSSYKSGVLIGELKSGGFSDVTVNKSKTIVKDADSEDRPAIQLILDAHNPSTLSRSDIAKAELSALDIDSNLSMSEIESTIKSVVRVIRAAGLLK